MTNTKNACRHFLGLYPSNRPSCKMGRDVRAWAKRCNSGSAFGIGRRLPCTRQKDGAEAPLFDCPDLDRRTDAEVETEQTVMSERMDRIISTLPEFEAMKEKMIAHNLARAKATCPWCGTKDALRVSVALGVNNHMRAHCASCSEGFME